jgi:hypothetical protein
MFLKNLSVGGALTPHSKYVKLPLEYCIHIGFAFRHGQLSTIDMHGSFGA